MHMQKLLAEYIEWETKSKQIEPRSKYSSQKHGNHKVDLKKKEAFASYQNTLWSYYDQRSYRTSPVSPLFKGLFQIISIA